MSKSVPEDYFEKLKGQIFNKIDKLEDELNVNAPTLAAMEKRNAYKVPEFYFAQLRSGVLGRKQTVKSRIMQLRRIAIAASVSLILAWSFNHFMSSADTAQLADNDILDYYISNIDEIDMAWVGELHSEVEEVSVFENIKDDELAEYISTVIDEVSVLDLYSMNEF